MYRILNKTGIMFIGVLSVSLLESCGYGAVSQSGCSQRGQSSMTKSINKEKKEMNAADGFEFGEKEGKRYLDALGFNSGIGKRAKDMSELGDAMEHAIRELTLRYPPLLRLDASVFIGKLDKRIMDKYGFTGQLGKRFYRFSGQLGKHIRNRYGHFPKTKDHSTDQAQFIKRGMDHYGFTGQLGKRITGWATGFTGNLKKREVGKVDFPEYTLKHVMDTAHFQSIVNKLTATDRISKRSIDHYGFKGQLGKRSVYTNSFTGQLKRKMDHYGVMNELNGKPFSRLHSTDLNKYHRMDDNGLGDRYRSMSHFKRINNVEYRLVEQFRKNETESNRHLGQTAKTKCLQMQGSNIFRRQRLQRKQQRNKYYLLFGTTK